MKNSEIQAKLESLRQEFKSAGAERQEEIKEAAEKLKTQLDHCRQCGETLPDEPLSRLCSQKCKDLYWGTAKRSTSRPLTMEEMRKGLEEMKQKTLLAKHVKPS